MSTLFLNFEQIFLELVDQWNGLLKVGYFSDVFIRLFRRMGVLTGPV